MCVQTKRGVGLPLAAFTALVFSVGVSLCQGANYPLTVTVSVTSGPTPNPAYVGEGVTTGLSASVNTAGISQEALSRGAAWTWSMTSVQYRTSSTAAWQASSYSPSITQNSGSNTASTATMTASFPSAAFWKVTVRASVSFSDSLNTWSGSGTRDVNAVAGTWVAIADVLTPSEGNPERWEGSPPGAPPGDPSLWKEWYYFCRGDHVLARAKGYTNGTETGGCTTDPSPIEGSWTKGMKWIPEGSTPKPTTFEYSVRVTGVSSASGDVHNGDIFSAAGGTTLAGFKVDVVTAPSSSTVEVTGGSSATKREGDTGSYTVGIGLGFPPSVSISGYYTFSTDSWSYASSLPTAQQILHGTFDSGSSSPVHAKATFRASAEVLWDGGANGPFVAEAEASGDYDLHTFRP